MGKLKMYYRAPAPDENITEDKAWEHWSLPLGNGYFGANVFGRTSCERIQLTENSLSNPMSAGGLNNFAEIYMDIGHSKYSDYERGLDLENGVSYVNYQCEGTSYSRSYIVSYPDNVMAVRLEADDKGKIAFTIRPSIPFIKNYGQAENDGGGKSGTVTANGDLITLSGVMNYYHILFETQVKVVHEGGELFSSDGKSLTLSGADSAVVLIALGTNYKMESRVFLEPDRLKKLEGYPHPHNEVSARINAASLLGFEALLSRHINDYSSLFGRVELSLCSTEISLPVDELLNGYRENTDTDSARYLEQLYFQYGRYLLISSSRPGTTPANLQGTWNCYDNSPWSCGYWHNINVQMNYWPAFSCNLSEAFIAYADYNRAYMPLARKHADDYIGRMYEDNFSQKPGDNGWTMGTGAWLYTTEEFSIHSGPGTGAFTAQLFWDYYEFTHDLDFLKNTAFPVLYEMSKFLSKTLTDDEEDGKLLVQYSASPEQEDKEEECYCFTVGSAFDQQMVWENHRNTLKAAELIGFHDEYTELFKKQLPLLDPVQVGLDGQVKEFREEEHYGDIGEYHHRHISHLVGLYPCTLISSETPEWLEAAKVTLNLRGDESTGWAMAHRLNLWARTGDGNRSHKLLSDLLRNGTLENLWDTHPPFQIDGNFGGTSGICEMLLQSHLGYIEILPAIPDAWKDGSFCGLVARGNVEVSAQWRDKRVVSLSVLSRAGGTVRIKIPGSDEIRTFVTKKGELQQLVL